MVKQRVSTFFNIQPGEGHVVSLIFTLYFFMGIAFVLTQTASYALFIDAFGSEGIPYSYIGIALGVSLLAFGYLRLSDHIPLSRLLVVNVAVLIAVSLLLRVGLALTQARWLVFLLPIWEFALVNLGKIVIWSLVGSLFDVRQSKRLFGLVTSGRWLAVAVGGLLVPLLVLLVGTVNLLWLSALSLGITLALLLRVLRAYPQAFVMAAPNPDDAHASQRGRGLFKNPFIVIIFVEAFIWIMAYFVSDNIYYIETARVFTDADQLASVLGLLSSVAGILTLISGLFFTGPFISRFGVQISVRVTPLVIDLLILAFAVVGTFFYNGQLVFALAIIARTANTFMSETFEVTSLRILVQPLPVEQRVRVSAVSDGIIEPLAIGTAGLLMVVIIDGLKMSSVQLAYLFLVIGAVWFAATSNLARRYRTVLTEALTRRWLGQSLPLTVDRSTVEIVTPFLSDKHPEAVIYALHVLDASGETGRVRAAVPALLDHPSSRVRAVALEYIERLRLDAALPRLQALLQTETDIHFREYALRALAALDPAVIPTLVVPLIDAPEIPIRRGALVATLRYGVGHTPIKTEAKLVEMAAKPDTDSRVLAAQIIGAVGLPNYHQALEGLLKASPVTVRRAALEAAGKIKHPRLWPLVIAALQPPATRGAAVAALVVGGESVLPAVRAAMSDAATPREVLIGLARACGQMTAPGAVDILTDRIKAPDLELRTQVMASLSHRRYRAPEPRPIHVQMRHEADFYTRLLATLRDLGSGSGVSLLRDALESMARQTSERLLYLMSFIYDPAFILRAREALLYSTGAVRATGLEILETYLDKTGRTYILPIFEDIPLITRLEQLQRVLPQQALTREGRILEILAHPPTAWVNICALYAAGQMRVEGSRPLLPAALASPDPVTRETARRALERLDNVILGGKPPMLSTLEKVIVLKTVGIFAETPDEVLADVAALLEEVTYAADEVIFNKGDIGNSLYIIISGRVRVHDGSYTLNRLDERQVFGEMALLDPAPRIATVTALEDTHLFRLRQEAFYELLDNRGEVARGIIRVLTNYLRSWVENADLRMLQQSVAKTVPLPIKRSPPPQ